jgi:four helix bundle protein
MRVKDFCDLEVWKKARDITVSIYKLTKLFPREERYGLIDQLRRSSNSICSNIAEGFNRYHAKDKIRFYYNARGSISESKSHVLVALELGYIEKEMKCKLLNGYDDIKRMLNGMINSIYRFNQARTKK